jgi:hypothetical protein
MIKRMIKGHPTESMPRQARESQGSRMIKAHPRENRMPRRATLVVDHRTPAMIDRLVPASIA